jgi:glutaredoxin 3
MVPKVTIYTTRYCPFCAMAKSLLHQKGVAYDEIDVTGDSAGRKEMAVRSGGRTTVPEIFIDGRIIGGFTELQALDRAGKLDDLLGKMA